LAAGFLPVGECLPYIGKLCSQAREKKELAEAKTSLTRWWAIRRMRVQVKKILNVFPGISG
jgi:hypothetical protein